MLLQSRPTIQTPQALLLHNWCLLSHRFRVLLVGAVAVALSLARVLPGVAAPEPGGFTQDCAGFAQDPWLQHFWSEPLAPKADKHATALATMAPRLVLRGTALATYERRQEPQPAATLEAVFGVASGAQREIIETDFAQAARGVVLSPRVVATVAHALTPDVVEVAVTPQTSVQTVPLRVINATLEARTAPGEASIAAQVAHVNVPYDLALLQVSTPQRLQSLPYPAVLSFGTGDAEQPTGGLRAGDCVAALVTVRTDTATDTGQDRLVLGKVLAKVPVATNSLTQTKLNVNMFTTDLAVQPGDSGAPVFALQAGRPVLVGLVSATMYPTAAFTYVTRIDPLLALAGALQRADAAAAHPLLVHGPAAPGLGPQ